MTGLVGVFIPFSQTMDLVYAIGGTLLFSGYIVYDTYTINRRLSPDEYIMGAISLYLEWVPRLFRCCCRWLTCIRSFINLCALLSGFNSNIIDFWTLFTVLSILRLLNNLQERWSVEARRRDFWAFLPYRVGYSVVLAISDWLVYTGISLFVLWGMDLCGYISAKERLLWRSMKQFFNQSSLNKSYWICGV